MKKILFLILTSLFFTKTVYAGGDIFSTEEITAVSNTLQAYALISAVIIAIVATIVVFRNARKMKGGVFGSVLNFFGIGMVAMLLGFISDSELSFLPVDDVNVVGNILFIVGYILMAIAAVKMSKAICE
ncbi:MAG: hypothetical protein KAI72_03075 [Candidatus Pacebacteria bacterium]|nr:hypothetical protein [Candidatus Paceibacterota bacterium]